MRTLGKLRGSRRHSLQWWTSRENKRRKSVLDRLAQQPSPPAMTQGPIKHLNTAGLAGTCTGSVSSKVSKTKKHLWNQAGFSLQCSPCLAPALASTEWHSSSVPPDCTRSSTMMTCRPLGLPSLICTRRLSPSRTLVQITCTSVERVSYLGNS